MNSGHVRAIPYSCYCHRNEFQAFNSNDGAKALHFVRTRTLRKLATNVNKTFYAATKPTSVLSLFLFLHFEFS